MGPILWIKLYSVNVTQVITLSVAYCNYCIVLFWVWRPTEKRSAVHRLKTTWNVQMAKSKQSNNQIVYCRLFQNFFRLLLNPIFLKHHFIPTLKFLPEMFLLFIIRTYITLDHKLPKTNLTKNLIYKLIKKSSKQVCILHI